MTEFEYREIDIAVFLLMKYFEDNNDLSHNFRRRLLNSSEEVRRKIAEGNGSEKSPLFMAANRGKYPIAKFLLEMCDVNVDRVSISPDEDDILRAMTPLCAATYKGNIELMELLISCGVNVNQTVDFQNVPLFVASRKLNLDAVKLLVNSGADVNLRNAKGQTSLMMALESVQICHFLLKHDARVNLEDDYRKTALHYATEKKLEDTVKLLKTVGATMRHNYLLLVLCDVAVARLEEEETLSSSQVPVQPNIQSSSPQSPI